MAIWLFTEAVLEGRPVRLFNHGRMRRDFTYIDDVVEAVVRLIPLAPKASSQAKPMPGPAASLAPWRVYNIGNSRPVELNDLIDIIEKATGKRAERELLPMRSVDVLETYADCTDLEREVGFKPNVPIEDGIRSFVEWYREFRSGTGR
jgi:UDP-glucuronate 4-epimerase